MCHTMGRKALRQSSPHVALNDMYRADMVTGCVEEALARANKGHARIARNVTHPLRSTDTITWYSASPGHSVN